MVASVLVAKLQRRVKESFYIVSGAYVRIIVGTNAKRIIGKCTSDIARNVSV